MSRQVTVRWVDVRVMISAENCKAHVSLKDLAANQFQQVVTLWASGPTIARSSDFFSKEVRDLDFYVKSSTVSM